MKSAISRNKHLKFRLTDQRAQLCDCSLQPRSHSSHLLRHHKDTIRGRCSSTGQNMQDTVHELFSPYKHLLLQGNAQTCRQACGLNAPQCQGLHREMESLFS
ncbi:hypothetical protein AVEN_47482-1 [Araneus ventricosus]|uniref:Uncharacterized protein n=1 Tax=Araneus ventricosus TaxID=182803 RepID=A0A4Y2PZD0_ARAVE|nr:hypothetical protein AVEN_47482-1 [Araneus ventricosus]